MAVSQPKIITIDLGGTQLRAALADERGQFLKKVTRPTEVRQGPEGLLTSLVELVDEITADIPKEEIAGIGLGIAAPVNPATGLVYTSTVLKGWPDLPLGKMLEERLEWPVFADNDVNLATLGESFYGAAKSYTNVVYLTVSTGVGAGIIENGRLLRGANGLAGELGHLTVNPDGPLCVCGNVGCLSLYINGSALRKKARQGLEDGRESLLKEMSGGDWQKVDARLVAEAARQNDLFASELVAEAAKYLGIGLTNILHIFNPEIIVIGGGVANMGDLLLDPARHWLESHAIPAFRRDTKIVTAALGDDGGLFGGVTLVKQNRPTN